MLSTFKNSFPNQFTSFYVCKDTERVKLGWNLIGSKKVNSNLNVNWEKRTKKRDNENCANCHESMKIDSHGWL